MKRFWTQASAVQSADGWSITLDGKPMRLPDGATLSVQSAALAEALAEEWQQAGLDTREISPAAMPLTGLAGTQARITADRARTIAGLLRYGENDLLCYQDASGPLAARQAADWQPLLDWAAECWGAALSVTTTITHVPQAPAALAALRQALAAQDMPGLTALAVTVPALGSLVLGLALAHGRLSVAQACAAATLDETWQSERWGHDAEAAERRARIAEEVATADRFMRLSRAGG